MAIAGRTSQMSLLEFYTAEATVRGVTKYVQQ